MENELSIKISATLEKASREIDKFIPKLKETDNAVSKMLVHLDKNGNLTGFTTELSKLNKEIDKTAKNSKNLKNALNLGATFVVAKKIFSSGLKWMQQSVDYSEALNLFNVSLDKVSKKGMKFQNIMNEAFGTNQAETLTRQGLYQAMAENMGIAKEYAYIMSENSTKLVNDISSLYNKDENTVAEALRAGVFAGQTKPLRSFGMDITESSLQPLLKELNITNEDGTTKSVRDLSQAEKQIIRYIAILRQSESAHKDWAHTIESPANQLKIFKNQLVEAQKALANLFINSFGQILPYANALLMVIKEVANAIAAMFGIKISDYNTGIADMSDAFVDLEDNVGDATDKIKELRKTTLQFDQIHNIDTKKNKSSGNDKGFGGIDQRLLDAITGYDNGMEEVRMKATKIRDRIMEWLGFTKKIDPLTGKVSFKYKGIKTTLKNIWDSFKGLSTTGKILVGLGLVAGATKLYNIAKKILGLLGGNGLVKTASGLITPFKSIIGYLKVYTDLAGKEGLTGINKFTAGIKEGTTAWGNQLSVMDKVKVGLVGAGGLLISMGYMSDAMKDIAENGLNVGNGLQAVASGFSSIASGAALGTAILPGWGTAIGAAAGGLLGLVTAMNSFDKATDTTYQKIEKVSKKVDTLYKDWEESHARIEETITTSDAETTYYQGLLNELKNITDENGNIKKGYEDRAKTITTILADALGIEIKIVDGQIQKYDELKNKIGEVIEKKKAQIRLAVLEEEATNAIVKKTEAEQALIEASDALESAENDYIKTLKKSLGFTEAEAYAMSILSKNNMDVAKTAKIYGVSEQYLSEIMVRASTITNEYQKKIQKAKEKYNLAEEALRGYNSTIYNWEKATEYAVNENYKELNYFLDYEKDIIGKSDKEQEAYWKKIKSDSEFYLDQLEKNRDKYGEELYTKLKNQYTSQITLAGTEMDKLKLLMDTKNGKISSSTIDIWKTIGETSETQFLSYLKLLPSELQTEVVDKMKEKGFKVSEELQKGLNEIKPSVDVAVNGPSSSSLDSIVNNITTKINGALSKFGFGGSSSNGGGGGTRANGGIYSNGKWHNINQYANGGLPSHGEMFIAREKGPELVGSIGSKTAVLNNGQIVESVSAGVYNAVASAMSQFQSSGQDIRVYAEEGLIVEKAVRGIQQHVNRTGELPFSVPM